MHPSTVLSGSRQITRPDTFRRQQRNAAPRHSNGAGPGVHRLAPDRAASAAVTWRSPWARPRT
ncbi:hypothetical protein ACFOLD_08815 [Kocuria carniphila]|uniref:hypothetical protein n=1 Tax=Kocuria carniphila TaxID=262208 RepID=UPI0036087454